jgi:hypothetical protein
MRAAFDRWLCETLLAVRGAKCEPAAEMWRRVRICYWVHADRRSRPLRMT